MTMRTSGMQRLAFKAPGLRHLSCLRLDEVLVLQGPPLLGAAFALRPPVAEHAASLAILTLANACLVAHVFVVNDWSNERADLADPNKRSRVFTANVVDRTEMAGLAVGLLAASLLLFSVIGSTALGLALGIAAFSTLYSAPRFDWKGKPFLNSAAHLAGGTLHFLLGYSVGDRIDSRGVLIASFFALIFAAGHLTWYCSRWRTPCCSCSRFRAPSRASWPCSSCSTRFTCAGRSTRSPTASPMPASAVCRRATGRSMPPSAWR
jgi:hypothetical protein